MSSQMPLASAGVATTFFTPVPSRDAQPGSALHPPITPVSFFLTPSDRSLSPDKGAAKVVAMGEAILSVDDETKQSTEEALRPAKKRRFVVTKADDTELLLHAA